MPIPVLDPQCACDRVPQSVYGCIRGDERIVRVLTDRHYKGVHVETSAFRVSDIIAEGVSLIRLEMVSVNEFQNIAEEVRSKADAAEVKGALAVSASTIRSMINPVDGLRQLCLFDDPVLNVAGEIDKPSHCMAVSPVEIDRADALEIRAALLKVFTEARYLHELFNP